VPIIKSTSVVDGEKIDIYIEVDVIPPSDEDEIYRDGGGEKAAKAVGDLFGKGLALSRSCATEVMHSIKQMNDAVKPNEFEVKIAIKLDSKVGFPMLVKLGAEAQMEVTMKWTLKETPQKP
jgi:Trypsin-co-occurring domain 1